ncbi:MAG: hypothetical protein WDO19_27970 [Bacteroidota bacterium]
MFKSYQWRIIIHVILLFAMLSAASFLLVKGLFAYLLLLFPVIVYQIVEFYNFSGKRMMN